MIRCRKCGDPLTGETADPLRPFAFHRGCVDDGPETVVLDLPPWMHGRDDPADRRGDEG